MEVHRGEVFYADLSPVVGSEQGGIRPVLIVQNEIGNRHSPTVIAAAITSRLDKARLPTHINIRAADTGLAKDSVVLLEQIRTLDKHRLRERAGQITPEDQRRVNQALDVSLGLDAVKEAARFGISSDRAVRFENDAQGVAVNYHVVSETVSRMREAPCCASIGAEWKEQIEADFQKRHHR